MKLSELAQQGPIKLLLQGDAGSGKSCFAASFPGPTLYLDFDGKANSAARYINDTPHLDNIDVRNLRTSFSVDPVNAFLKIIMELSEKCIWQTIVLDSITTFSASCLAHIVKTNPGLKRNTTAQGVQPGIQDYGILKREFRTLIPGLLGLPCNVIMNAHLTTEKDELTGEIVRGTMMDGSFGQELPIHFEEVWRAYVDAGGQHLAQTKSDFRYKCRTQIPNLPNPLKLNYQELKKFLI